MIYLHFLIDLILTWFIFLSLGRSRTYLSTSGREKGAQGATGEEA